MWKLGMSQTPKLVPIVRWAVGRQEMFTSLRPVLQLLEHVCLPFFSEARQKAWSYWLSPVKVDHSLQSSIEKKKYPRSQQMSAYHAFLALASSSSPQPSTFLRGTAAPTEFVQLHYKRALFSVNWKPASKQIAACGYYFVSLSIFLPLLSAQHLCWNFLIFILSLASIIK